VHQLADIGISLRRFSSAQPCAFGFTLKQTRPVGSKVIQEDRRQAVQFRVVHAATATIGLSHMRMHLNGPLASKESFLVSLSTVPRLQQKDLNYDQQ
jgi:hypothetical protein